MGDNTAAPQRADAAAVPLPEQAIADGFARWAMGPAPTNWWALTEAGKCRAAYTQGVRDAERAHKIGEAL